ncbi:MAG TPA: TIGR01458 family HAD-type hydrolase [Actinomycetota bacterium]|nr:TIGR01458 family HAD-type hydrolase [Actinomycetota bacterium]
MPTVEGLLLDIDGVLLTSWKAIPGAIDAMAAFRAAPLPLCLITNTTTHPRTELAATLEDAGFDVEPNEIVTAVTATADHLRRTNPDAAVFLLSDGDARTDLDGVRLVDDPADADVIALGGASNDFTYATVNRIFGRLMEGDVALVAMHRNMFWRASGGFELDAGAYVAGLEAATGVQAVVCGKPAPAYFEAALSVLGVEADRAAMVGDDVVNDVDGARAACLTGILVRTGKFRADDLDRGSPDHVVDSLADVPALLGLSG